jgi:hypothetical protein
VRIPPQASEHNGRQPHHRANGQIDAARNDHWCERQRQQSEFDRKPGDLKCISGCPKISPGHAEYAALNSQHDQQHPLFVGK